MEILHQTEMREDLLEAWAEGSGDPEKTEGHATILSHHIRSDEEGAKFHFATILRVADGPMPVPTANMILHDCYLRGWGTDADETEALRRIRLAIKQGSEYAKLIYAGYLLSNDKLADVLPHQPTHGLAILRKLVLSGTNYAVTLTAAGTFSSYVAQNIHIDDVSPEDLEIINRHADDTQQVYGMNYLHLARFFAGGAANGDYSSAEYRRSRELLIRGCNSRFPEVRDACDALLSAWGVRPVAEPEPTKTQKTVQAVKLGGQLGGVAAVLVFWSIAGVFLMAIAAAINAVVIPIGLGVLAVGFLTSRLRR